jgi:hypothetical protein
MEPTTGVHYAVAVQGLAIGLTLPLAFFATLTVVVERRVGPRWLPALWVVAICVIAAFLLLRARGSVGAAAIGGTRGLVFGTLILFGIPFAVAALAAWRVGAHRPNPRPTWIQSVAVIAGAIVGLAIGVVVAVTTEPWWSA